jgi:hypothetical protein
VIIGLAGCGQTSGPASTTTQPVEEPLVVTAESTPSAVQDEPAPARAQQWAMPDLVGSNLQDAQDQIQRMTGNPVFITRSHDATGKKRNQVVDSNWQVCSQNIAPGKHITAQSDIDFGAVKLGESCS